MKHAAQIGFTLFSLSVAVAAGTPAAETQHPLMGDWEGEWAKGWPKSIVAQVIPCGDETYQINLLPEFDQRVAPLAVIHAQAKGNKLQFEDGPWSGKIEGQRFTGTGPSKGNQVAFEMKKVTRLSPNLGARPPKRAVVLFDGSGFDQWEAISREGPLETIPWKSKGDAMEVGPTFDEHAFGISLATRTVFTDFRLHLEFRLPLLAEFEGQNRANSGVIIEDYNFYEVQILDSYGLVGYYDDCGGIYKVGAAKANMCSPPLQWQSYDIIYRGPRYGKDGKRTRPARITVDHNGKLIHKDVELPDSAAAEKKRHDATTSPQLGRIKLQNHGDPVQFRNVWMVDLSKESN